MLNRPTFGGHITVPDFYCLFRSDPVEEDCDDGEDDIREPEGDGRRKCAGVDEHLAEAEEEDVGEGKCDTYTDVPTDTAAAFL